MTLAGELPPIAGEVTSGAVLTGADVPSGPPKAWATSPRTVGLHVADGRAEPRPGRGEPGAAASSSPSQRAAQPPRRPPLRRGAADADPRPGPLRRRRLPPRRRASLGLAPLVSERLLRAVREAADGGLGVVLVEQHVRQALAVADRVYVFQRGRVVLTGSAAEMGDQLERIEASYLSGSIASDPRAGGTGFAGRRVRWTLFFTNCGEVRSGSIGPPSPSRGHRDARDVRVSPRTSRVHITAGTTGHLSTPRCA